MTVNHIIPNIESVETSLYEAVNTLHMIMSGDIQQCNVEESDILCDSIIKDASNMKTLLNELSLCSVQKTLPL